jgi:hypothetical protein
MPITWQSRVRDLQSAGLTLAEIGALVGLATSTIGDLAVGRIGAPGGEAALKLHELHKSRCGSARAEKRGTA